MWRCRGGWGTFLGVIGLAGLLAACGGNSGKRSTATTATTAATTATTASGSAAPPANACPPDGCQVRIADVSRAGAELRLRFDTNYTPDMSRNHVHVFWDTFTAKQVSDDAERRFGVTQGDWVPTADNPYTTGDAASVSQRGQSHRICVTAGDRDHNVLNPDLVDCRDVSNLLSG